MIKMPVETPSRYTLRMFRRRFAAVVLVVAWLMTPEMLCLLPGVDLTMDEHECCKRMAGECDMVPMPDLHKCCKNVTPTTMVVTAKANDYPALREALLPFTPPGPELTSPAETSGHPFHDIDGYSPSHLPRLSTDILRI